MLYSTASFAYQNRLAGFTPFWRDRLGTHTATPGKVKVRGGRNSALHREAPPSTPTRCECGPGPSGVPRIEPFALPEPFWTPTRADLDALRDGNIDILVGAPMRLRAMMGWVDEYAMERPMNQRTALIDLTAADADSVLVPHPASPLRRRLNFSAA